MLWITMQSEYLFYTPGNINISNKHTERRPEIHSIFTGFFSQTTSAGHIQFLQYSVETFTLKFSEY